jgi:hypothetical protein
VPTVVVGRALSQRGEPTVLFKWDSEFKKWRRNETTPIKKSQKADHTQWSKVDKKH